MLPAAQAGTVTPFSPGSEHCSGVCSKEEETQLRASCMQPRETCHKLCTWAGNCAQRLPWKGTSLWHTQRGGMLTTAQPDHEGREEFFLCVQTQSSAWYRFRLYFISSLCWAAAAMFSRAAVQAGSIAPDILCSVCLHQDLSSLGAEQNN